jgi:hypothetical protein
VTYPQQPYGGQQPDPYGQQPGQYGGYQQPQGGYQQQPGGQQYGGYDPNAQYPQTSQYPQGSQYPQYGGFPGGQYGGGGYPPPEKKNTGMIVAVVAIVVLLLGGLGITGFVAPGFFLSDDKSNAGGNTDGGTSSTNSGSGADAFIDELVQATDAKDTDKLKDLACDDAESNVQSAIDDIDQISGAKLTDTKEVSDSEVTAILDVTVDGSASSYDATVVKNGSDWCWNDIARSGGGGLPTEDSSEPPTEPSIPGGGGGGGGGSGEGQQFVQGFLDAVNGGDAAGAKSKLCSDSTSQGDIDDAVQGKASLQMDTSGIEAQDEYVGVDLKGTLNGAPTSAARTSAFLEDGGWCIFTFYAF